jgi:hypothetical protein
VPPLAGFVAIVFLAVEIHVLIDLYGLTLGGLLCIPAVLLTISAMIAVDYPP